MSSEANSPPASPTDRLDSWKQIAAYLGRSERTVRRWEENEGLPVHRLRHEQRGSVYAYRAELDAWMSSRDQSPDHAAPPPVSSAYDRKALRLAAAGVSVLVLFSIAFFLRRPSAPRPEVASIVVLPFENLSHNAEEEWFSDGLTETLTTELVKLGNVEVISRTSAMQYKASKKTVKQIASELGVDAVVEGSALRVGGRVRISAQLIVAATDTLLWGRDFDRDLKDVLTLQREVAQAVAQQVGIAIRPGEARPVNPEAMAAYLKGLYQFNRGALSQAIDYAREGIRIDPEMARPHELLGISLVVMADFGTTTYAAIMPEARSELQRALALEPDRGVALNWLGWTYFVVDHDWAQAESKMRQGFELDPSTGNNYAYLLAAQGRFDEAIRTAEAAMLHDPANSFLLADGAHIYYFARRFDDAIRLYRKSLELNPSAEYPQRFLFHTLLTLGRTDEAFQTWLRTPEGAGGRDELSETYRKSGWPGVWRRYLDGPPKMSLGRLDLWGMIFLGRRNDALNRLEDLEKTNDSWLITLEDPVYDPLRPEPRFKALLQRNGYPHIMWQ